MLKVLLAIAIASGITRTLTGEWPDTGQVSEEADRLIASRNR